MKRMLINATQEEELRMAMVDGQRLYDLNIELPASERTKANIYKGKITRIEPSLEAAFVDYGADRHGFLPLKEISSEYFVKSSDSGSKVNIKDVMREGQDIVVQIDKEERGNKGAALTTFVSLAGRFIVLKPNKARSGGVSRRIVGSDRDVARDSLKDVEIPDGMSVILRTAGIDRNADELSWDLENLLKVWQAILNVVLEKPSPFLIYRESDSVVRALRDYLTNEIGEILIDDEATYKDAKEFVEQVMPHNLRKLKHYSDPVPLFTRYQIESQIESAFSHSVNLPSGGSIVIDHTEALVSIDINSARATKGGDIEATALNTNSEAAEEIARQLRLRDLGGLIVIDFIDMGPQKNQRDVENRLRDSVRQDRARVQIGKISRFGLLEMSRQRLRPSLGESSYHTCPRCSGIGTIRSIESLALTILRIIGEEARKERTSKVIAQLPVEVATYLLNEKRDWVQSLESRNDTQVILVANASLETPHYQIRRVRDDQMELAENSGASYELTDTEEEPELPPALQDKKVAEPAAVATMKPTAPAPAPTPKPVPESPGFWAKLFALFSGESDKPETKKPRSNQRRKTSGNDTRKRGGQRNRQRNESKQAGDNRDSRDSNRKKRPPRNRKKTGDKQQQSADKAKQTAPATTDGKPQDEANGETAKPARSRRSRGGRRRRRGGERTAQDSAATENQDAQASAAESPAEQQTNANTTSDQPAAAAGSKEQSQSQPVAQKTVPATSDDGPPKARTDAERVADSSSDTPKPKRPRRPRKPKQDAATDTVASSETSPDSKPAAAEKPATAPETKAGSVKSDSAKPESVKPSSAKPAGRLLPWEPAAPTPVADKKPEQSSEKKSAGKSDSSPAADATGTPAAGKTDKPAEKAVETKPAATVTSAAEHKAAAPPKENTADKDAKPPAARTTEAKPSPSVPPEPANRAPATESVATPAPAPTPAKASPEAADANASARKPAPKAAEPAADSDGS